MTPSLSVTCANALSFLNYLKFQFKQSTTSVIGERGETSILSLGRQRILPFEKFIHYVIADVKKHHFSSDNYTISCVPTLKIFI